MMENEIDKLLDFIPSSGLYKWTKRPNSYKSLLWTNQKRPDFPKGKVANSVVD